jgi:hypothetical protein
MDEGLFEPPHPNPLPLKVERGNAWRKINEIIKANIFFLCSLESPEQFKKKKVLKFSFANYSSNGTEVI